MVEMDLKNNIKFLFFEFADEMIRCNFKNINCICWSGF